jgi:putative acetyltransferase
MKLRPATRVDVDELVRIYAAARAEATPWLPVLHTDEEHRTFFGGRVEHADVRIAELDGRVCGFAVIGDDVLGHLYVDPGSQRRGVGTALLEEAMRARPHGFTLWTHQANDRARHFYDKHGLRVMRMTDGVSNPGNEERLPDVLYEWKPKPARD